MSELQAIVAAFCAAREQGERAAMVTVIEVTGSAYRRPGARMLLGDKGTSAGVLSGGCLERDLAERAVPLLATGGAQVVEYDTRGREDLVWGLGLGCNGVMRVLLESLQPGSEGERALNFLAERLQARRPGVMVTAIGGALPPGRRLLLDESLVPVGAPFPDAELAEPIRGAAAEALAAGRSQSLYLATAVGPLQLFCDVVLPPRELLVLGAELDALPVVRQARALGWRVTVVDTRARPATPARFAEADEVLLCSAEELPWRVVPGPRLAVAIMTHNYHDDLALLRTLLPMPAAYLGILGPRKRTQQLLDELATDQAGRARLHFPIGLDLGADTPETIALAIIAEIQAVCTGRQAGPLRERAAPIHHDPPALAAGGTSGSLW